jgi:nucleotide-binding universal stress UspA family protein
MSTLTDAPVVVGVDGTPGALRAVALGAAEASRRHRPLRVVHAFIWPMLRVGAGPPAGGPPGGGLRQDAERVVAEALDAARGAAPGLPVGGAVVDGQPAAVLLDEATRAALVVLGDRELRGFTSVLVGSVALQIAGYADCPVLVARGEVRTSGPVVAGVDGSPTSEPAIAFAAEEATLRGARLMGVHAFTHPPSLGPGDMMPLVYSRESLRGDEDRVLAEALAGLSDTHPDLAVTHRLRRGRPAPALIEESARAQLVVVGALGRSSLAGLVLGSVSHALLHHAGCPLAIVRGVPGGDGPGRRAAHAPPAAG